jgi:AraC-like DNA-binding protein
VYPALLQQYVTFVAYLCGGEVDSLVRWLVQRGNHLPLASAVVSGNTTGTTFLQNLLWQLFEASLQSHDAATARQALQALQNLIHQQFRVLTTYLSPTQSNGNHSREYLEQMLLIQPQQREVWSCLLHEMTRTVLMSAFSSTSLTAASNGALGQNQQSSINNRQLSADRIDSFSSAFFALVLFMGHVDYFIVCSAGTSTMTQLSVDDLRILQMVVQNILSNPDHSTIFPVTGVSSSISWTPAIQTTLWTFLRTLFTDRNLSLTSLDKRNRMEFTKNFREFLRQLRSLSVA